MTAGVAVLGWGAISAGGVGEDAFRSASPSASRGPRLVEGFDLAEHVQMRGLRSLSRASRLACAATAAALDHPRPLEADPARCAVVVGSRWGHIDPLFDFEQTAAAEGPSLVNPSHFPNVVANVHAGYLAILFGLAGPNVTVCGPGAGLEAIGIALDLLALERADVVLAGGVEALGPALLEAEMRAGGELPPGEGAAFLLLGRADRGRRPLAEVAGFASGPAAVGCALANAELEPTGVAGAIGAPAWPSGTGLSVPARSIAEVAGDAQAAGGALAAAMASAEVARVGRPFVAAAFPAAGTGCALVLRPAPSG